MAKIEHIALWVNDIDRVCAFYARYFGATIGPPYQNKAKGFTSRFLSFESGARIEVMNSTSLNLLQREAAAQYLGIAHIAIALGNEAAVDALTSRLKTDRYTILDGPRRTGDGYYESVVLDPEGNRVEITA
jgi:lactoylglutathione lyase